MNTNLRNIALFVAYLLILPILLAMIYNKWNETKITTDSQKILEQYLHPFSSAVEEKIAQLRDNINNDNRFQTAMSQNADNSSIWKIISGKITDSLGKDFNFQLTVCKKNDNLLIDNSVLADCYGFFAKKIHNFGRKTNTKNLYLLTQKLDQPNFLLFLGNDSLFVFIEIAPKNFNVPDASFDFSIAHYKFGSLIEQQGRYNYPLKYSSSIESGNRYIHQEVSLGDDQFILSRRKPDFHTQCGSFSVIFLSFLVIFLIFYLYRLRDKKIFFSFASRIQLIMFIVSLSVFAVAFIFSVIYLLDFDKRKNNFWIREKAYSVLLQMEKIYGQEILPESLAMNPYLSNSLSELSNIFFVDASVFYPDGKLMVEQQGYSNHNSIKNGKMDTEVFEQMNTLHRNFYNYIVEDSTNHNYLYCYVPFRNYNDCLLGYLELRFTLNQQDIQRNAMSFTTALLNIFVFLIIGSFIVLWLLTSFFVKPIRVISDHIGTLQLNNNYKKINIERNDELGQLIETYNRVVADLEVSTKKLAQTERQTAWNEMAKQIAHEIKNPLTPIKLNIQQIARLHKVKDPNFDEKFEKFVKILLQQIDALTIIADEFRDFTKLEFGKEKTNVDILTELDKAVELFGNGKIPLIKEYFEAELVISADPQQLGRVFINLLKNAFQAITDKEGGIVKITVEKFDNKAVVKIIDNGCGISEEIKDKIFEPNFTTKSSGMGLGLAISKKIVESFDGSISFKSSGNGTVFTLMFPVLSEGLGVVLY
jgi:signal transduction histidine kinase